MAHLHVMVTLGRILDGEPVDNYHHVYRDDENTICTRENFAHWDKTSPR